MFQWPQRSWQKRKKRIAPHAATIVRVMADRCSRTHLRGVSKPRHPVWKAERTTGKAAHTIPTIRAADITIPWLAANNLAVRPSFVLQYMKPSNAIRKSDSEYAATRKKAAGCARISSVPQN